MAPYKTPKIEAALKKKGFRLKESHHKYWILVVDDKATAVKTYTSHGNIEYSDTILAKMRKQLGRLSPQQFDDLIECPLGYDAYVALLRENFVLPKPTAT